MKVPTFATREEPISFEDAMSELAHEIRRVVRDGGGEILSFLERRLRPEEADAIAGRPRGWAYREIHAGRLDFEKDSGGEREGRGRVGAVRIPMKVLLETLEARRVRARGPVPRRYRRRSGSVLSEIRSPRHQAAAGGCQ